MKVLHVHDVASVAYQLVYGLRKAGIQADLLDYKKLGVTDVKEDPKNIKPIMCNKFTSLFKYPLNLNNYDIVHVHYPLTFLAIATLMRRNKKTILHAHGTDLRSTKTNRHYRLIVKWACSRSDLLFYSTPDLKILADKFHSNSNFLPNPIDTDFFRPIKSHEYENRVLIFSSLNKFKRMEISLGACKLLDNIKFDVVFFGPHREYYREKYKQDNVSFIPPVDHSQIPSLLAKYPLVIGQFSGILSLTELESMACGKPVITYWKFDRAYPQPAPVLSAQTPADIARLVKEHFGDKQIGKKAREWVKQNHGTTEVTKKLISIYESL